MGFVSASVVPARLGHTLERLEAHLDKTSAFQYTFRHETTLQNDLTEYSPESHEKRLSINQDSIVDLYFAAHIECYDLRRFHNRSDSRYPEYGRVRERGQQDYKDAQVFRR